jgi:hypothetical protein
MEIAVFQRGEKWGLFHRSGNPNTANTRKIERITKTGS